MLATFEREYSLATLKNEHLFESALDTFKIKCLEIAGLEEQGFFGESADEDIYLEAATEFMAKVKEFFANLIKNIKEFVQKITIKISSEIQAREINKKLEKAYDNLAHITINDTHLYKDYIILNKTSDDIVKDYKKYVTLMVKCTKTLYSKEYKSVEEYQDAYHKLYKVLEDARRKLEISIGEGSKLEGAMNKYLELSKKEIASHKSVMEAYQKMMEEEAKALQELAENEDDVTKVKDIQKLATNDSNWLVKGLRTIAQHPIATATTVLAATTAVTAAGVAIDMKKGSKK